MAPNGGFGGRFANPRTPEIGKRDLGATAAILWLALLPRLYVALAWAREPVWDGHYYDFGARRIAAGRGYSDDVLVDGVLRWHPWCHYPVGYSGFLAGIYAIFGNGPHVATVANAIVGALLAAFVHRLARYGISIQRARIAGLITALMPGLILYAALLMTEPLAALGMVVSAWLAIRDDNRLRGAALGGLALGLASLVRPQSLLMAPAFVLLFVFRDRARSWRRASGLAAVVLAASLVVIAPWTARNCKVMDGCALVSTNAGWNLAIGSFPRATGRFETLRSSDGCDAVTGQVDQDRCWLKRGVGWIEASPGHFISLIPKKLGFTFDHESFPIGYLGEADPDAWPEARRALWRELLSGAHRLLLVAAALAFVARAPKETAAKVAQIGVGILVVGLALFAATSSEHVHWPIALAIPILAALPLPGAPDRGGVIGYAAFAVGSVCLTHAVFFGEDRYHVVVTPLLALLAAATLRPARASEGERPI
jgi:4-amino-4-deoxy-L-arabinose transferase-like glycosyltransferase